MTHKRKIDGARAALPQRENPRDSSSDQFATRWLCDMGEEGKRRGEVWSGG